MLLDSGPYLEKSGPRIIWVWDSWSKAEVTDLGPRTLGRYQSGDQGLEPPLILKDFHLK